MLLNGEHSAFPLYYDGAWGKMCIAIPAHISYGKEPHSDCGAIQQSGDGACMPQYDYACLPLIWV